MSIQEVQDSYEFKLAKKILLREYPWIKDVTITDDPNLYKFLIFVNLVIDSDKLSDIVNIPLTSTAKYLMGKDRDFEVTYLSVAFDYVTDDNRQKLKDISDEVNTTLEKIHTSKAIPPELKLRKQLSTTSYIFK